jgi:diguanylate cyclase (GGDEF)-like protein/PAS domain S-box-containing protein
MSRLGRALLSPLAGVAAFAVVLCACVGAILVFKALAARDVLLRQNEQELQNLAHSLAVHTLQSVQNVDTALMAVVERMHYDPPPGRRAIEQFLQGRRQLLPQVRDFGVLDADGHWRFATFAFTASESLAEAPYYTVHRDIEENDLQIGAPAPFRGGGVPTVVVSRRIAGPDGRFAGVALATLDLSAFSSFYKTFDVGSLGRITLSRTDGLLIADNRDAVPGNDAGVALVGWMLARDTSGHGQVVSPIDGAPKFIAWEQTRGHPLLTTVSRSVAEVLAPWRRSVQSDLIVALGLIAAVILIALALAMQFRNRLAAERRLSEREAKYRLLTENAGDVVMQCRTDGTMVYVSPAVARIVGWREVQWLGRHHADFVHHDDRDALLAAFDRVEAGAAMATATYRVLRSDLTHITMEGQFRQAEGSTSGEVVACLRDVTERQRMEDELRVLNRQLGSLASTDGLTGLPNRRAFDGALLQTAGSFAVLMIDVDYFKPFNDHYGHLRGDDCLKKVAMAIAELSAPHDGLAARYGGEEFAVILPGCPPERAAAIADAMRDAVRGLGIAHFAAPLRLLSVSVGLSHRKAGGKDPVDALREADFALYEAKRQGRNRTVVFDVQQLVVVETLGAAPLAPDLQAPAGDRTLPA